MASDERPSRRSDLLALDATLVTRDRMILAYGARGTIDVLPA